MMQSPKIEQKAVAQNICQSPKTSRQKLKFWAISTDRNQGTHAFYSTFLLIVLEELNVNKRRGQEAKYKGKLRGQKLTSTLGNIYWFAEEIKL